MVNNVHNIIYGLFRQRTYRLIEKIRCIQIQALELEHTNGDKYGRKEKKGKRLLLWIISWSSSDGLSGKQKERGGAGSFLVGE